MQKSFILPFLITALLISSCKDTHDADMIIINGQVATVNPDQPSAEAVAIRDGRIFMVSTTDNVVGTKGPDTKVIDADGRFVMPGFVESHGHFSGLGNSLMILNFLNSENWTEIVADVEERVKTAAPGEWITGRGWHQEKWNESPGRQVLGYPYHDDLSAISPDNPVILRHASGHGVFANKAAMDLAGISKETPDPAGGKIVRDASGEAIGVFEETAMGIIYKAYQDWRDGISEEQKLKEWHNGIDLAEADCLKKGITSFQDAGASFDEVQRYTTLAKNGDLDLRLWSMIRRPLIEIENRIDEVKSMKDVGNQFFTVGGIKVGIDGALGSYGAWLLEEYEDQRGFLGQNTTDIPTVKALAKISIDRGLQYCVHAIGDRANRETLDIFEETFKSNPDKTDLRWRIEHSQHLHPDDIPRFAEMGVIAAMQGVHCTSDAPFVEKRLGYQRAKEGAYPWRTLLESGAVVTNGTDAPVEDSDPIPSFYASVTRKHLKSGEPFFPEQSMTRAEAVHSYTLAGAYAAFQEDQKGSLEVGKLADIVILSNNLLTCTEEEILDTDVLYTIVGGQVKYEKD